MQDSPQRQSGSIVLNSIVVVLVIGVLVLVGIGVKRRHSHKPTASTTAITTQTPPTSSNSTDNSSLNNDMSGVNAALTQNGQSLDSANTAINDSQQQVTVPTN